MLGKIKIPVVDTESGKYEYRGELSNEEYGALLADDYNRNKYRMDNMAYMLSQNQRSSARDYRYDVHDVNERDTSPDVKYVWSETEAFIQSGKRIDVDESYFDSHLDKRDMFVLVINVNPTTLEPDAESELRFWLDDSRKIHNDRQIDDKTKLRTLPMRDLKLMLYGREATLCNCKILQNYSDRKYPFYFGLIVEKITY